MSETFAGRMRVEDTLDSEDYDEFGWLPDVAEEAGLAFRAPRVHRREIEAPPYGRLSGLQWGDGEPQMILLHGGRQNAHTWDAVLQALDRSALALDLPGHGRSFRRADGDYGALANAAALAPVLPQAAPRARILIGMSLGGLTAIRLAPLLRGWAERLVLVDSTPPTDPEPVDRSRARERGVAETQRLARYDSFDDILSVAAAINPRRSLASVARETRLNAERLADGGWSWRFDVRGRLPHHPENWAQMCGLWDDVDRIDIPTLLVHAEHSRFVPPRSVARFRERLPGAKVALAHASGHAIQTDQPRALAALIREFCFS